MAKQLIIKIMPDGTIKSETVNIKGKACEKYMSSLEKMTDARIVDSDYTGEFYETENLINQSNVISQEAGR